MAGASTPEMAAAAANAGALGSLGVALDAPERIVEEIRAAKVLTNGALNLNFFCHRPPEMDQAKIECAKSALAPFYAEFDLGTPPTRSRRRLSTKTGSKSSSPRRPGSSAFTSACPNSAS